jgi:Dihydrodipicolinate synthetase family
VILYNFPLITAGIDFDSDMILALAQHPNIVGIKLTCANVGKLHRVASTIPFSEFAVLSGKSDILLHGKSSKYRLPLVTELSVDYYPPCNHPQVCCQDPQEE